MAAEVFAEQKRKVKYLVGTMIEVPRGALTAGEIARTAEFFSFGTNDLTQTTFGLSRDDAGTVLNAYVEKRDLTGRSLRHHRPGWRGRADEDWPSRPAGPPAPASSSASAASTAATRARWSSATQIGLDYVSCSPYRLPIARLAAAQAVLKQRITEQARAKTAARKKVVSR